MKNSLIYISSLLILFTFLNIDNVYAQDPPSAIMELESTTQGFLPPRMTSSERDVIANPAEGMIIYNISTQSINYYDGLQDDWIILYPPNFSLVQPNNENTNSFVCLNAVVAPLLIQDDFSASNTVYATDFLIRPISSPNIQYSINKIGISPSVSQSSLEVTCVDMGFITAEIHCWLDGVDYIHSTVTIIVQDNLGQCN